MRTCLLHLLCDNFRLEAYEASITSCEWSLRKKSRNVWEGSEAHWSVGRTMMPVARASGCASPAPKNICSLNFLDLDLFSHCLVQVHDLGRMETAEGRPTCLCMTVQRWRTVVAHELISQSAAKCDLSGLYHVKEEEKRWQAKYKTTSMLIPRRTTIAKWPFSFVYDSSMEMDHFNLGKFGLTL